MGRSTRHLRVRSVPGDGPGRPPVAATVGSWPAAPDLVTAGVDLELAPALLEQVASLLFDAPELATPDRRLRLPAAQPWPEIELAACHAPWAVTHAVRACELDRATATEPAALLQVVVPDAGGRFPDDPAVDVRLLDQQPVLSDAAAPWPLPHGAAALATQPSTAGEPAQAVLLPIVDGGHPIGRDEAVHALAIEDDLWVVSGQPTLADWCAVGAVVRAHAVSGAARGLAHVEVARFDEVTQVSPRSVYRWELTGGDPTAAAELSQELRATPLEPHLVIGETALPHAVTIAVPTSHARRLSRMLRGHEGRGLIRRRRLFHEPPLADPSSPIGGPDP